MILSAIAEKLKRRSKDDFKGRHFEAALILQAVSWYLRYPLSYRDIEELFLERGLEVDHSTLNRWVLAAGSTSRDLPWSEFFDHR
jgi:transposase, IS6 family